jgi:thiol-disulfide isomerase/thioredoxin
MMSANKWRFLRLLYAADSGRIPCSGSGHCLANRPDVQSIPSGLQFSLSLASLSFSLGRPKFSRSIPAIVVLLLVFLCGASKPAISQEIVPTSFGKGKVQVRLYTDYFCGPCSRMEPKVENILADLVRRNVITLTFVDTPVHKTTTLYARYFLYVCNFDRTLAVVLRSRAVLFDAAKNKIEDKEGLEEYLRKNNVRFREMDPRPAFAALSSLMSEDDIRSTPTCVIIRDGKKGVFAGEADITKALEILD